MVYAYQDEIWHGTEFWNSSHSFTVVCQILLETDEGSSSIAMLQVL